jgi:hypothetical protein
VGILPDLANILSIFTFFRYRHWHRHRVTIEYVWFCRRYLEQNESFSGIRNLGGAQFHAKPQFHAHLYISCATLSAGVAHGVEALEANEGGDIAALPTPN